MAMTDPAASKMIFVVDSMLGKVAKWLRVLGYDTLYLRISSAQQIQALATQGRLLVTRNRKWRASGQVVFLDANDPAAQMQQLVDRLHLPLDQTRILTRCIRCNKALQPIPRSQAEAQVPDAVLSMGHRFHRCPDCGRIYWPGTHSDRMLKRLQRFWDKNIEKHH